ncbi:hypothetical protein [Streptomyces sp. Qhu_M48]|uniref:hypothetical protein n=1 Tax=Streptomyces sp. Qhu_M48 TaxID=3435889 RepID=UPI003F4FF73B
MIRIEPDEVSLGATRIVNSPPRDAFCSTHLAPPHRAPSWPYQERVGRVRAVWREDDRLRPLWDLFADGRYEVSDFLLPRPVGTAHVHEELDPPRATDPAFVREQCSADRAADAARGLTAGGGPDGALLGAELAVGAGWARLAVALLGLLGRGSRRRTTLDTM